MVKKYKIWYYLDVQIWKAYKSGTRKFEWNVNRSVQAYGLHSVPLENWKCEEWGCWVDQDVVRHLKSETFPTSNHHLTMTLHFLLLWANVYPHYSRAYLFSLETSINGEENQALSTHLQYSPIAVPTLITISITMAKVWTIWWLKKKSKYSTPSSQKSLNFLIFTSLQLVKWLLKN